MDQFVSYEIFNDWYYEMLRDRYADMCIAYEIEMFETPTATEENAKTEIEEFSPTSRYEKEKKRSRKSREDEKSRNRYEINRARVDVTKMAKKLRKASKKKAKNNTHVTKRAEAAAYANLQKAEDKLEYVCLKVAFIAAEELESYNAAKERLRKREERLKTELKDTDKAYRKDHLKGLLSQVALDRKVLKASACDDWRTAFRKYRRVTKYKLYTMSPVVTICFCEVCEETTKAKKQEPVKRSRKSRFKALEPKKMAVSKQPDLKGESKKSLSIYPIPKRMGKLEKIAIRVNLAVNSLIPYGIRFR